MSSFGVLSLPISSKTAVRRTVRATLAACALSAIGLSVLTAQTPPAPRTAAVSASVVGVVFDSIALRPLAGAIVQLVNTSDPSRVRSATANERGAYRLDSIAVGVYVLGFIHPRLDSLGIEASLVRVDVQTDGQIVAALAIPSARTILTRVCGPTIARDSLGVFMGYVRSARGDMLSGIARIRAQWLEITLGSRGIDRRSPITTVNTSPTGAFSICGVPTAGTFSARAFFGPDSSGVVELEAPRTGLLIRDIYIGSATKTPIPGSSFPVLRGTGALRGTVRSISGQPIRGARLVLWGSGVEDSTSIDGQFSMKSLPSGTYTLEARAIGFLPRRIAVDVPESTVGTTELNLDAFVPTLDEIRVRADRDARLDRLADFKRRQKNGLGYFLDEALISRRNPIFMSDLLRATPGVTVVPSNGVGDRVMMRGSSGGASCVPALFLDGSRVVNPEGVLDQFVNPQSVRAVEVYSRAASMPSEFQTQNGCGSIVVWTGMRTSR
jgi:hypothetical protein